MVFAGFRWAITGECAIRELNFVHGLYIEQAPGWQSARVRLPSDLITQQSPDAILDSIVMRFAIRGLFL